MKVRYRTAAAVLAMFAATSATAAEAWVLSLTPQYVGTSYGGSPVRDGASAASLYFRADYLERASLTVGGTHSTLKFKTGAPELRQNGGYLSGTLHQRSDALGGRISLRADVHAINNNDATGESDHIRVYAGQLAYLTTNKGFGADVGYARSRYGDSTIGNGSLQVNQWTPTLGFALNDGYEWLQLRYYRVAFSNPVRAQGLRTTSAIEAKWIHYFAPNSMRLAQTELGVLAGKRIFGVDSDTGSVYSLADMQKGSLFGNAQVALRPNFQMIVGAGYDRYEAAGTASDRNYYGKLAYIAFTGKW